MEFPHIWIPPKTIWIPPVPKWRENLDPLWYPEKKAPVKAAISFRAAGAIVTGTATSITPTAPAGIVASDIVLAIIYGDFGTGAVTPPAGWTLVNRTDSGTAQNMVVYWALGSATFGAYTIPAPTNGAIAFTVAYIGVDTTTPMDATSPAGTVGASSATITASTMTSVTNNAWFICFFGIMSLSTFTPGAGLTSRQAGNFSTGQNSDVAAQIADGIQAIAGATGTHTTTASIAGVNIGVTAALRPVAVAATGVFIPYKVVGQGVKSAVPN